MSSEQNRSNDQSGDIIEEHPAGVALDSTVNESSAKDVEPRESDTIDPNNNSTEILEKKLEQAVDTLPQVTAKRTVVVAEDESINRMDLVAMLEDNHYEVVGQAANGEEAIALTRQHHPDVVCMDIAMPKMDGVSAAAVICDENIAPVVMLTAFSEMNLVKKAADAGAMAYVTKPYEESKLIPAIEVAMGRFAEINELLDSVENYENRIGTVEEELRITKEKLSKTEESLEERKFIDRAKGLLMYKAHFSEQEAFRWIQKTSMDQRVPKKRLAQAIIAKYAEREGSTNA